MRNSRHQFILLGFLAQSLVWDSWVPMLLYAGLWVFCVGFLRGRVKITLTAEALILMAGCILAFAAGKALNKTTHFFLGEGLILLQAARLIRPLNKKERLTSILIACFHFGVVCTLAPNVRFALLFLGAVLLFPKALQELHLEDYTVPKEWRPRLRLTEFATILCLSLFAFMALPRFFTGAPIFARGEASLLDSVLDPSRSGSANSDRVLLQLTGERIGYLRCYALAEFDGVTWSMEKNAPLHRVRYAAEEEFPKLRKRIVRVKTTVGLGRVLPTDGNVRWVGGNFFAKPLEDAHGIIETTGMWNTANNVYEYWVETNAFRENLSTQAIRKLTYFPVQSERLHQWLKTAEKAGTNALTRAQAVEGVLRSKYSYRLGTPELNRLNPVEDFIFNRSEGHCERFAAAMALFLRMQGVPSRVVIGYAATTQNPFTGWQQVRFKDAHAWTEGYFEGVGWKEFDATPGPPADGDSSLWQFMEAVDFAWYAYVVNFDGLAQRQLFRNWGERIAANAHDIKDTGVQVFSGVLAVGLLSWVWINRGKVRLKRKRGGTRAALLNHAYGRMLSVLENHGWPREAFQTPEEFLKWLREVGAPGIPEVELITSSFCRSSYGLAETSKEELDEVEEALQTLATILRKSPESPNRMVALSVDS